MNDYTYSLHFMPPGLFVPTPLVMSKIVVQILPLMLSSIAPGLQTGILGEKYRNILVLLFLSRRITAVS